MPHRGDPARFTPSGFPTDRWEVKGCGFDIPVRPPFRVSEAPWFGIGIRVPLAILDAPRITSTAEEGVMAQTRLSFVYPSHNRIKEDLPLRGVMALEQAPEFLASARSHHRDGTDGSSTYFGEIDPGREIAMTCGATNWPNPLCFAEVQIGSQGRRYYIELPPKSAGRLQAIVAIGDRLFADAERRCSEKP